MKIISHRGNLNGRNSKTENSIKAINLALKNGFDVEIDVWLKDNNLYLGHDEPVYKINKKFLQNKKLWCHAKNFEALNFMLKHKNIICFWHQNDKYTLTSNGFIWTNFKEKTDLKSIIVLKDKDAPPKMSYGICTDFPLNYL
jgi:glycerophosphoryl diester phosphodiesterase